MATAKYVPVNGVHACTCKKRVEIMGWRYGEMYRYFCSQQHAEQEGACVDAERKKAGMAPVRDRQ